MNRRERKKSPIGATAALVLAAVSALVLLPLQAAAQQADPASVIKQFNEALLKSMKGGDRLGYRGRYELLAPVIRDSFALSYTARAAAGRYWATFSEEQRQRYLKAYTDWTIATYAGRFDEYAGETFTIVSAAEPLRGTVTVVSRLGVPDKPGKDEVEFHYQLRKLEGGWRIADIRIEGVSQLALTRSQFVSILKKKGFEGLMETLRNRIERLARGSGK